MSTHAPRSAVQAERHRAETARQDHHAGRVTLAGVVYDCSVELKPARHLQNDQGLWELKQSIRVVILKTQLATLPAKRATLLHDGVTIKLAADLGGCSAHEPAWIFHGSRKLAAPP